MQKRSVARAAVLAAALMAGGLACQPTREAAPSSARGAPRATASSGSTRPATATSPVARGRYLVAITGCNDCHTPMAMGPNGPAPDMSRMLSGHPQDLKLPPPPTGGGPWLLHGDATNTAFAGPWGISYAMNLTPDPSAAFHAFTEETFVKAMRTGKHFGEARPIMPPMPWQAAAQMTDDDLKAVYVYLRSIPPVKNRVPDWQPPAR